MKKIASILITIIICLPLTGCWDSVETEKLGVVTLLGVQLSKNNNIKVTIQELSPKSQSSGNQPPSNASNRPFYVYSEEGSSISGAIQKISSSEHQKIYFAHTKIIILDENLVESIGIEPVIDFYERTPEMRLKTRILISKSGQLDKIMNINTGLNVDTGSMLEETISNEKYNSYLTVNYLKDFIEILSKPGSEAYSSGISLLNIKSNNKITIKDTAVFKKYKMIGWLKKQESRGLAFVNENLKGGYILVPFEHNIVSLKIIKATSKIHPVINNGNMQINLNLNVLSNIAEDHSNSDFMNKDIIKKIEQLENDKIKYEITLAINKSKNLNSDIFGFGSYFNMYYPKSWKNIKNNWDLYYPNIQVNINVNSTIKNIGGVYKLIER
ncbi:Ger(x)C family germination protein [Clostridium algifaecis]|uniref:Ger(X)C family germination protein n=1 Tax=Clostridium algifaecis TaxID=1472040 RepID=A0ABS4KP59_9CLOT|nr:Ger(x)C family spore germination protein [Clostridium algifaecis]MBP2031822.1 Ger(x)C family germination protein [Clostridium algifaecis]